MNDVENEHHTLACSACGVEAGFHVPKEDAQRWRDELGEKECASCGETVRPAVVKVNI